MKIFAFKPHVFTEHFPTSDVQPKGRIISKIRCDDKNVYIYNGKDSTVMNNRDPPNVLSLFSTKPEFRGIWVFNLLRQQWRLMRNERNLPDDNDFIFGTLFESNYLVIWTIEVPSNNKVSSRKSRLHICDLNTENVYVQETDGQVPISSFALDLIRHGKYLYTVGIVRGFKFFPDVYKLNIENGVWEVVYICRGLDANEPVGRVGHSLVYGNKMIYIFGGTADDPGLDLLSFIRIPAFDLEKCCWKIVDTHGDENHTPQYPAAREDFGVTSYTDPDSGEMNVIISGGGYDDNVFNSIWRLNLTSLKWTCLERFGTVLPHFVENNSMTVSPAGKLFTFGGYIYDYDMEQGFCISTLHSTWLRIPKLTDICWEAIFHYYPNLTSMTDEELYSLGIPLHLLKPRIN
ncbi:kelch domain-containing protein 10 homolog [Microplitis mediator]|uniref:kelch domain-containing protein 10 homolog n=1 Tax=Microplitis mediator TaxID=375433 RepID=UPI0025521DE7|nr:kelch domain-containing protein 10 homolog [Microplitis mediator]